MDKLKELLNEEGFTRTKLDFLGFVPCPIKPAFKWAYDDLERQVYKETGEQYFSYVPSSCNNIDANKKSLSNILTANSIDEIPDITCSFGMSDYVNPKIVENYTSKGSFERVFEVADEFKEYNLYDKYNAFTPISLFATVIMIDKKRIGNLPIPKSFEDLLNPIYKNSIIIPGGHGETGVLLPMHYVKYYGEEALEKLENNTINVLHGSKIAKIAGSGNSESAPIYVVPWCFAKACENVRDTEIIWPKEGAIVEPQVLIVKKNVSGKLNKIIDFMKTEKVAKIFADNYFISTMEGVDNKLPKGAKFNWIGWDYVFENPVDKFKEKINPIFQKYIK